MKKLIFFLVIIISIVVGLIIGGFCNGQNDPCKNLPTQNNPPTAINDNAHVIDKPAKDSLEAQLRNYFKTTGIAITVVTIESLGNESITDYSLRLFNCWGIGNKESDAGLLILNSIKERKVWIEVGYGLEGIITDAVGDKIARDSIAPYLKNNNFTKGLSQGVQSLITVLGTMSKEERQKIAEAKKIEIAKKQTANQAALTDALFALGGVFVVIAIILIIFYFKEKNKEKKIKKITPADPLMEKLNDVLNKFQILKEENQNCYEKCRELENNDLKKQGLAICDSVRNFISSCTILPNLTRMISEDRLKAEETLLNFLTEIETNLIAQETTMKNVKTFLKSTKPEKLGRFHTKQTIKKRNTIGSKNNFSNSNQSNFSTESTFPSLNTTNDNTVTSPDNHSNSGGFDGNNGGSSGGAGSGATY